MGIREPLIAHDLAAEGGTALAVNASAITDSLINEGTEGNQMKGVPIQIPIPHQAL